MSSNSPQPPAEANPDVTASRRGPGARRLGTVAAVAIALVLIAEVGVRVASSQLGEPLEWYSRGAQDKAALLEAIPTPKVAFIGSSAVDASFDPGRFEDSDRCKRTAFNAGIAGATPTMSSDFLERAVEINGQPSVVVVGVTPRDFSEGAQGAEETYFRASVVRDDVGGRADRFFSRYSYLVRYRTMLRSPARLKGRIDEYRAGRAADERSYDARGWAIPATESQHPYDDSEYRGESSLTTPPVTRQVDSLARLVRRLQRDGVDVVIAEMAFAEGWNDLTPTAQASAEAAHDAIADVASETGVEVIDFRAVSDRSLFLDPVHTNAAGSAQVTDKLVAALPCAP